MAIRLHPKHGLNPTMPICAWCDKDTGEVALLGASYKGEAPMRMVLNDEPCRACKEFMAQGITFIEFTKEGGKRTGRWCVVKEEAVREIISDKEMLDDVLKYRKAALDPATSEQIGLFKE